MRLATIWIRVAGANGFVMKGVPGMPAAQVARAYVESVEGKRNGQVLDARKFA